MSDRFERFEREFSAAEVAEYFGVPEVTQRDWRRRFAGTQFFRPAEKGKKFLWKLSECCALSLAKVQADAGKSVPDALWVGSMCAGATILNIELMQQSVGYEGIETTPAMRRKLIYGVNGMATDDDFTRYLFFPTKDSLYKPLLPQSNSEPGPTAYHFSSLAEMSETVTPDWVHGQIFNLSTFALSIAAKMKGEKIVIYRKIGTEQ